jgi:hypothetical protein
MKDLFNTPIKVGDSVIYMNGKHLAIGNVVEDNRLLDADSELVYISQRYFAIARYGKQVLKVDRSSITTV